MGENIPRSPILCGRSPPRYTSSLIFAATYSRLTGSSANSATTEGTSNAMSAGACLRASTSPRAVGIAADKGAIGVVPKGIPQKMYCPKPAPCHVLVLRTLLSILNYLIKPTYMKRRQSGQNPLTTLKVVERSHPLGRCDVCAVMMARDGFRCPDDGLREARRTGCVSADD